MREPSQLIDGPCVLAAVVGRDELCPGPVCGFWEEPAGCSLHAVTPHLKGRQGLARHLYELRERLDEVRESSATSSVIPRNEIQRGR